MNYYMPARLKSATAMQFPDTLRSAHGGYAERIIYVETKARPITLIGSRRLENVGRVRT